MVQEISAEELAAAMANATDANGNDIRLAEFAAHLSAEARRVSEDNLRQWLEDARTTLSVADP